MASTFKTLLNDDVVNTRTLLHEAIPITGTIVSGTYSDNNVKTYTHGMFESTFDYPYLSSSANHIFDVTYGYCHTSTNTLSSSTHTQNSKKINIYNQFAQVLMGYDTSGSIRKFDSDGTLDDGANTMNSCFFLSFSRLLVKDEVKKGSFTLQMYPSGAVDALTTGSLTLGDYGALNEYRTSPSGDYGLLFTSSADAPGHASASTDAHNTKSVGLIFYQAGVVVLSSSFFQGATSFGYSGSSATVNWGDGSTAGKGRETTALTNVDYSAASPRVFSNNGAAHNLESGDVIHVHDDVQGGGAGPGIAATGMAPGLYEVVSTGASTFTLKYADNSTVIDAAGTTSTAGLQHRYSRCCCWGVRCYGWSSAIKSCSSFWNY